jgi:hypothetical protein
MERADVTRDDGRVAIFVLLELLLRAPSTRWLLRSWNCSMTSSHDKVGGGSATSMLRREQIPAAGWGCKAAALEMFSRRAVGREAEELQRLQLPSTD